MRPPCFECGEPSVQDHHVIPRSLGGTKTVPLCLACHSKVHGIDMAHPELTRAALAAYKARGGVLGSARPECRANLSAEGRIKGAAAAGVVARELADEAYVDLVPEMRSRLEAGLSCRAIARALNDEGHTTRQGKPWNHVQVRRVLDRAARG